MASNDVVVLCLHGLSEDYAAVTDKGRKIDTSWHLGFETLFKGVWLRETRSNTNYDNHGRCLDFGLTRNGTLPELRFQEANALHRINGLDFTEISCRLSHA